MIDGPSEDPYTHAVMQRISPSIRASFTLAQRSAIEQALAGGQIGKGHAVDIRLTIPLFFARYYLVWLMGRDQRVGTRRSEAKRHQGISVSSLLLFFFIAVSPVVVIMLLILYALKTALGINLMPDLHLKDFLRFW
jgi:hypothetical protein